MKEDSILIQEVIAGQNKSFSLLVEKTSESAPEIELSIHQGAKFGGGYRAREFLKAYQKLSSFEGRSSFKSWLFQITVKHRKKQTSRNGARETVNVEDVHLGVDPGAETGCCKMI